VLGNGFYLFQLFDQFAGTIPLLLIAICEYVGVACVYGTRKLVYMCTVSKTSYIVISCYAHSGF